MKDAEVIEAMARAIAGAEFGYSLKLTRLVDGVSTYELKFSDSDEVHQFEDTEEAYELIAERKRMTQARAAFAIFPIPHDGLTDTSHHAGSSAGESEFDLGQKDPIYGDLTPDQRVTARELYNKSPTLTWADACDIATGRRRAEDCNG